MDSQLRPLVAFIASAIGAVGFIVAYSIDADNGWLGLCLAVALGGFGTGLVLWGTSLETGDATEERHRLVATEAEMAEQRVVIERGTEMLGRRKVIVGAVGAAVASLGAMLLVPLRSLGPAPTGLKTSPWRPGRRLVTSDGQPVPAESIAVDGLLTVYPEGDLESGSGPVLLLGLTEDRLSSNTVEAGALGGLVAYSKICTHAGCAVGLFQADSREPVTIHRLLCPCHQSEFDPFDGAHPVAGPATRSLPQLPIDVDDEGNLIATDGFSKPVGPAFWTWP